MINKRGMSIIEIIVSLALVSIVLMFLVNLFLNIRNVYNQSKIQSDYKMVDVTIERAVGSDIENYGLHSISYASDDDYSSIVLTFNQFRITKLSERIKKVLKIYQEEGFYKISYTYEKDCVRYPDACTSDITADERVTNVVRIIPKDAILNMDELIRLTEKEVSTNRSLIKIKIPLIDPNGNIYDINMYGLIDK